MGRQRTLQRAPGRKKGKILRMVVKQIRKFDVNAFKIKKKVFMVKLL